MDNITIVSGYWQVNNKFNEEKYNNWFNTSLKINQRYIFFCEEKNNAKITKYRNDYETIFMDYSIDSFYSKQYYKDNWIHPVHVPSKELGMIWHEKIHMMKLAKDYDENPTDFYVWIDAGVCIFRDNMPPQHRLNLKDINMLPHNKLSFSYVKEDYHNFSATVLIMHKTFIDEMHSIYYNKLLSLSTQIDDWRLGSDQFVHTHILLSEPNVYNKISDGYGANLIELYKLTDTHLQNNKLNIIIIAPGKMEIPPNNWGAIESIVWDYYEILKSKNINVRIVNNSDLNVIVSECNSSLVDIVHIMYDDYIYLIPYINCKKIIYTSHYAYITHPNFKQQSSNYYNDVFMKVIEYQSDKLTINAISNQIANKYKQNNFNQKINIIHNGARSDLFLYNKYPLFKTKSVYIGKIEYRKAQYKYQSISDIDFVGNYANSPFDINSSNYIGIWSKNQLYNNLTNYSNLILLSDGEADPLVVKEALIAGLGVVISECASANLDKNLEFITIIPNDKLDNLIYVKEQIKINKEYSINNRNKIREYALENFDWSIIIDNYLKHILI